MQYDMVITHIPFQMAIDTYFWAFGYIVIKSNLIGVIKLPHFPLHIVKRLFNVLIPQLAHIFYQAVLHLRIDAFHQRIAVPDANLYGPFNHLNGGLISNSTVGLNFVNVVLVFVNEILQSIRHNFGQLHNVILEGDKVFVIDDELKVVRGEKKT